MASREGELAQITRCYQLARQGLTQKEIGKRVGISIVTVRKRLRSPEPGVEPPKATVASDTSEREQIRAEISTVLRAALRQGALLAESSDGSRAYQEAVTGMARISSELAKLHGLAQKGVKEEAAPDGGGKVIPKLTVVRL